MAKDLNRKTLYTLISDKRSIFIVKLFILVAIIGLLLCRLIPRYETSYTAGLIDKVDRLESISEPKIVLIGNSNVAFGFNSKIIEDAMGMPVVNMGMHGEFGNKFHDDMMGINVTPGDIYVVCHISYWRRDYIESPLIAWTTFENHTNLWQLADKNDYPKMYESFSAYIKKATNRYINFEDVNGDAGSYCRQAFNEYGDIATERIAKMRDYSADIYPPVVDESEVVALNEWKECLEEQGATLLIAGFPIIYDQWAATDEEMDEYQDQLEEEMDCDVISNWRDYCYSETMFYDTPYHLTNEGAKLRSLQLVDDLNAWKEMSNS